MQNVKYLLLCAEYESLLIDTIQSFSDLYRDEEFSRSINLSKLTTANSSYVLTFPEDISVVHLQYAVNFFRYPFNKAKFSNIYGFYGPPDNRTMLFVPESDDEGDNCYSITMAGEVTKHSFDGMDYDATMDIEFSETEIPSIELKLIATIQPSPKRSFLSKLFGKKS